MLGGSVIHLVCFICMFWELGAACWLLTNASSKGQMFRDVAKLGCLKQGVASVALGCLVWRKLFDASVVF